MFVRILNFTCIPGSSFIMVVIIIIMTQRHLFSASKAAQEKYVVVKNMYAERAMGAQEDVDADDDGCSFPP